MGKLYVCVKASRTLEGVVQDANIAGSEGNAALDPAVTQNIRSCVTSGMRALARTEFVALRTHPGIYRYWPLRLQRAGCALWRELHPHFQLARRTA